MLVLGLGVGAVAYGLSVSLVVSAAARRSQFPLHGLLAEFHRAFFAADGSPLFFAFLAYFGALFVIPKWWKRADPVCSTRLSIWHTVLAIACSWIITAFWPFPQPWLALSLPRWRSPFKWPVRGFRRSDRAKFDCWRWGPKAMTNDMQRVALSAVFTMAAGAVALVAIVMLLIDLRMCHATALFLGIGGSACCTVRLPAFVRMPRAGYTRGYSSRPDTKRQFPLRSLPMQRPKQCRNRRYLFRAFF